MSKRIDWIKILPFRTYSRISYDIVRFLPEMVQRSVRYRRYMLQKKRFHRQVVKMTGSTLIDVEEGPAQSAEIALATSRMTGREPKKTVDTHQYFAGTYKTMHRFLRELEEIDFGFENIRTILDFGCGSARFARILRVIPETRIIATDKNIRCIEWCSKKIPSVEFYTNQEHPPLSFAKDNSIDLIIAYSVFTHIPIEIQKEWLQELFRITRPGGVFLCTVLGVGHAVRMLNAQEHKQLREEGHYSLQPSSDRISLSSKITGQQDVFQTHDEMLHVFGESFEVLRHTKATPQDILILRKPL